MEQELLYGLLAGIGSIIAFGTYPVPVSIYKSFIFFLFFFLFFFWFFSQNPRKLRKPLPSINLL